MSRSGLTLGTRLPVFTRSSRGVFRQAAILDDGLAHLRDYLLLLIARASGGFSGDTRLFGRSPRLLRSRPGGLGRLARGLGIPAERLGVPATVF